MKRAFGVASSIFGRVLFTQKHSNMATKSALVILAEGAEEMEAIISVDVLRRAGLNVTLAGLNGDSIVQCSRKVCVKPDVSLNEAAKKGPYDVIVLPGGEKGAKNLCESAEVGSLLKEQDKSGRLIAGICAGPTALKSHGIGHQKKITSHPTVKQELEQSYKYSEDSVVQDGNLITSRAPGTAFEFALKIVENLEGKNKANELITPLMLKV